MCTGKETCYVLQLCIADVCASVHACAHIQAPLLSVLVKRDLQAIRGKMDDYNTIRADANTLQLQV